MERLIRDYTQLAYKQVNPGKSDLTEEDKTRFSRAYRECFNVLYPVLIRGIDERLVLTELLRAELVSKNLTVDDVNKPLSPKIEEAIGQGVNELLRKMFEKYNGDILYKYTPTDIQSTMFVHKICELQRRKHLFELVIGGDGSESYKRIE